MRLPDMAKALLAPEAGVIGVEVASGTGTYVVPAASPVGAGSVLLLPVG